MPYANIPDESLWPKMDSCVEQVMAKDGSLDKQAAVAICYSAVVEGKSEAMKAFEDALKIGARNARQDAQRLQMIHDYSVENGAQCQTETNAFAKVLDDALITFGSEVKALGGGKVGGYLVKFSTAQDPDLTADYFTPQTDYGTATASPVLYHHGLDTKIGKRVLGDATLTRDEVGIWAEAQLKLRDAYEQTIYKLAEAGKLGWSSGTASHLVERKAQGHANEITRWPLGLDASLTPTPAEPRNGAIALKTYQPTMLDIDATPQAEQDNRDEAQTSTADADQSHIHEVDTMSEEVMEAIKALGEKVNALETVIKNAPPVSDIKAAHVEVTQDEGDRPFKSLAEQFSAVKTFALNNKLDPRLQRIQVKAALGGQEGVPSEGGFLIDPTLTSEILMPMHEVGPFTSAARKLPVGPNSNYGWINGVNETNRSTGRWGGIVGYRLAEAGSKTASKPAFRRINWELKKFAVLVYGTDELLADAAQFSTIVRMGASEELSFMANDDVLNGAGAAGPFGILQSPCLVSVDKESGQAAATILTKNLSKMWMRLTPRSKGNAAWFINGEVTPQLDELTIQASLGVLEPRFVNYNAGGTMSIYGRPVVTTEFNAALGTVGDIVLADMSEYLFWEKGGVQEAVSIHVAFLTDETCFRLVYRCDGQPALNAPITPYKGSATTSPFVALATRA